MVFDILKKKEAKTRQLLYTFSLNFMVFDILKQKEAKTW